MRVRGRSLFDVGRGDRVCGCEGRFEGIGDRVLGGEWCDRCLI